MINYIPNRLLDLTDILSFGVALPSLPYVFPATLHANVHATRALQLGLGSTNGVFMGKDYGRRFLWGFRLSEISFGPVTSTELGYRARGPSGELAASIARGGTLLPTDQPFAERLLDYYAVGGHVGILPIAIQADIHPYEIADFLAGLVLIDLSSDDN